MATHDELVKKAADALQSAGAKENGLTLFQGDAARWVIASGTTVDLAEAVVAVLEPEIRADERARIAAAIRAECPTPPHYALDCDCGGCSVFDTYDHSARIAEEAGRELSK